MSENKVNRDYSYEHRIRAEKKKRLVCEMDKTKAQTFQNTLKDHEITFSDWLHEKIDEYMKEAK
jgi:hypothetical protein